MTIFALSTGSVKSGIAIIRISGPQTLDICKSLTNEKNIKSNPLNFEILNNLNLQKVEKNKFPLIRLLNKLPKYPSLFETVLITINDYLVNKFLDRKINFIELTKLINKISNYKEFQKFKKIKPRNIKQIYNLRDYVHLKLNTLGI